MAVLFAPLCAKRPELKAAEEIRASTRAAEQREEQRLRVEAEQAAAAKKANELKERELEAKEAQTAPQGLARAGIYAGLAWDLNYSARGEEVGLTYRLSGCGASRERRGGVGLGSVVAAMASPAVGEGSCQCTVPHLVLLPQGSWATIISEENHHEASVCHGRRSSRVERLRDSQPNPCAG